MAFQYAPYQVPQAPKSSLAAFLPAFEEGRQKRADEQGLEALAALGGNAGPYQQPPGQPQGLAALDRGNNPLASAAGGIPDSYLASVVNSESGGNPNARNPNSSATGLAQFTDGTWQSVMQQHPELGLTPDGRTDPGQATRALRAFTLDNARTLSASGVPVGPGSLYAAHFLGSGGAAKVLRSPDDAPMASLVPNAVAANPTIANMTVGQFKQWANQKGGGENGGYVPPTMGPDGHPAAVADRAGDVNAFQAMGAPGTPPAAPGEPVLALAANNMPQGGAPAAAAAAAPQQNANGLPSRETMLALLKSEATRPLAIAMIKAVQEGQSPAAILDMQLKQAQIAKTQQDATSGDIPSGYRRAGNGLEAIPGGPYDPANPLNSKKLDASMAPDNGLPQVSFGANGLPDPAQQQEFLSKLDPGTAGLVKSIANYQADITKVTSLRGDQRQRLAQMVQQYDPSYDMTQYGARAAMRKSITSGAYSQTLNSSNLVIQHLDALATAADGLHNQGMPAWNALANATKTATGDPAVTKFNTIADAAAAELAKVFKGVGATDLQSVKDWRKNLDPNSSPEQIHTAIETAIGDLLKSRIDTIQNQYQAAMGHPLAFTYLTPHSREVLTRLGIDPTELDPLAGNANAAPSSDAAAPAGAPQAGHVEDGYRFKGGDPADQNNWEPV